MLLRGVKTPSVCGKLFDRYINAEEHELKSMVAVSKVIRAGERNGTCQALDAMLCVAGC